MLPERLARLTRWRGKLPRWAWNGMVAELPKIWPILAPAVAQPDEDDHPFKVRVERFIPPEGRASARPDPALWRVDIVPGCVNDEPARIAYAQQGDERGWEMPEGYLDRADTEVLGVGRRHPCAGRCGSGRSAFPAPARADGGEATGTRGEGVDSSPDSRHRPRPFRLGGSPR